VSHPKLFRGLAGLALSLAPIMAASAVWAWGDLCHRVICQIAFQELNDPARTRTVRLIADIKAVIGRGRTPRTCTRPETKKRVS